MAYATVDDLAVEFEQPLGSARAARATVLLDRAALLIDRVPGVAARATSGVLNAELLKMVSVDMVRRALRPDAKSETIGPKSVTYRDSGEPGLYLLDRELQLLAVTEVTEELAARSVRMARPAWWLR